MDTAIQIAASIRAGSTTAQAVLNMALARIESLDAQLSAWVEVDREAASSSNGSQSSAGPLAGVPVGVKDIIDVAGLPSRLGASAFAHKHPGRDSRAVARLRAAGASVLGKTHTTQFAYLDPAPTLNPWRRDRTPGGSSSGSAVAVAAGMVPIALGSQTVGSVLRPAAYCGIVGLKPTFGRIAYGGTANLAPSFDHIGVLCCTVADAALALSVLAGRGPADPQAADAPVDDFLSGLNAPRPPRIGFARAFTESAADSEVTRHMFVVAQKLSAAGAIVSDVELPLSAPEVLELGQPILRSEAAVVHAQWYATHAAEYGPQIRGLIEAGVRVSPAEVERARAALRGLADGLESVLRGVDVLLIPAAPTTAPTRETTGNGIFCAAASFTGLPAIALPSALGADGLPLSVQLVSARFAERTLLATAAWCERYLAFGATPSIERG